MNALVIGATGLVGSHVARTLAQAGSVVGTGLTRADSAITPLDIRDAAAVRRLVDAVRPDVIVCAAAEPHVDLCEREPERTRAVNVAGVEHVAAAARAVAARLVYFSSDYVFDGKTGAYAEDAPVSPLNEYGRQKVEAERIVRQLNDSLVLRVSGVFGVDDRRKNFVYQVIDRLRAGEPVQAPDDQTLCPTWASDIADTVGELLRLGFSGVCHVVGPDALVRVDFARRIAAAFDLDAGKIAAVPFAASAGAAPRPACSSLSDARLRGLVGHGLTPVAEALQALRAAGL